MPDPWLEQAPPLHHLTGRVLDADGKTVAVATGSAMLVPGRPASLGAAEV